MKIQLKALLFLALAAGILIYLYKFNAPEKAPKPDWKRDNSLLLTDPFPVADDLPVSDLAAAVHETVRYLQKAPADREFRFGPDCFSAAVLASGLLGLKEFLDQSPSLDQINAYITEHFRFYKSAAEPVLFTGYYEPLLKGSYTRSERYNFPLYRLPEDLYQIHLRRFNFRESLSDSTDTLIGRIAAGSNEIIPYYNRQEIDHQGSLSGRGLEILWVDSPVDAFFLQIQGSGIVELADGSVTRVRYAGKNGHPYRPIGRKLKEEGLLDQSNLSMQAIRQYLDEHPEDQERIFNYNPSYVFFELSSTGPFGATGAQLVPGRSIATDLSIFPAGALAVVKAQKPLKTDGQDVLSWEPFQRLVLNQDTGGAITGAGRVDLFVGSGEQAALFAGHLKAPGELFMLAPGEPKSCQ